MCSMLSRGPVLETEKNWVLSFSSQNPGCGCCGRGPESDPFRLVHPKNTKTKSTKGWGLKKKLGP